LAQLTLADRAERYSDFGATNNPQFGTIWKAATNLSLRGTYGTSFKAPLLSQLNPVPSSISIPGTFFTPAPGGTPTTLLVDGGNSDLKPERATVWTAGMDFRAAERAGFSAKFTYYHIVFKDQIVDPTASICGCLAFADESLFGPSIVQRNPPPSLIQQLTSLPTYLNPYGVNPASISALLDSREVNLSTVKTQGVDLRAAYKWDLAGSRLETGLDGTYVFDFDNQFSSTAPVASFRDTPFNPTHLRLRGRLALSHGPVSGGLYLNYTSAYMNNAATPEEHVASWTTADAVATYRFDSPETALRGTSLSLSIINLAGRDPPYVLNPLGYSVNFDGANANALGRFISLRLQKHW
jgi:outer membrane receptor protein involved in Fe transport